jgi:hypothetical protein
MPPLLMTTLFSILLNLFVPHANVTLPHVAPVSKIMNVAAEISFD